MKKKRLGCFTTGGVMAAILTAIIITGFAFASGGMLFNPGALNALTGSALGGVSSHAQIAGLCNTCHTPFWGTTTMADKCVTCHTDVAAQWQDPSTLHGVLRQNNPKLACRNCHPDHRGPNLPLIDLSNTHFPHNSFGFELSAHQTKADGSTFTCNDCHAKVYTSFDQAVCATCHAQIEPAFMQPHSIDFSNDCLACHDGVETYGHDFEHAGGPFKLTGKHTEVQCTDCHLNAKTLADLQATPQDCNSCHAPQDPHQSRYGTDCAACHTTSGWTPATFDHNLSTFKLDGKHVNVPCEDCHSDHVFVGTPKDCISCHQKDDTHTGSLGTTCNTCHSTAGWKPASYDHNLSAFILTGKHANVECKGCHVNNVFKGTPSDCISCHQKDDSHNGSLGTNCNTCHSTTGWKPASYDHNLATFKLTGKHTTAACKSCHVNNIFKDTPSDCNSCHKKDDRHNGRLGSNCGSCHTTSAWLPSTFNHDLTAYKLTGRHITTACLSCHVNGILKGTPTGCNSCHNKNDHHNGQFGTSCETCHTTSAWLPATFDHNQSVFKLTGKHSTTACLSCHVNNIYKGTPSDCNSCHKNSDAHRGSYGTNCAACHTTVAWKPATLDHNLTAFKLTGGHSAVACLSCHVNNIFKGTPADCNSCHKNSDPHAGQFGVNCSSCHTTTAWLPATYNHNLSTFKLTGRHSTTACANCHVNNVYKGTPSDCYSCHKNSDPHSGRFGTNCGSCHTTTAWLPASFDHNLSTFKLTGRHTTVTCVNCHVNNVYKGTPTDCYSCHKNSDPHSGRFGTNCSSCHTTSAWLPASFDHNLSTFKLTGQHTSVACANCHVNNVYKGTATDCYSCHRNSDPHGGRFGTDCGSCHTTSAWLPASFDHNISGFALTGAHTNLNCTQCHSNGNYGGLSPTCVACHAEPSIHAGVFGTDCAQCHSTSNWNATFNHPGGCEGNCANHEHATCAQCHPVNYSSSTCTACHERTP